MLLGWAKPAGFSLHHIWSWDWDMHDTTCLSLSTHRYQQSSGHSQRPFQTWRNTHRHRDTHRQPPWRGQVEERNWELFRTSYMIIGMVAFKQGYEGLFLHTNTLRETHRHRHIPSEQKHTGIAISGHQGAKLSETILLSFPWLGLILLWTEKCLRQTGTQQLYPNCLRFSWNQGLCMLTLLQTVELKVFFNVIFFVIFYENIIVNKICKN